MIYVLISCFICSSSFVSSLSFFSTPEFVRVSFHHVSDSFACFSSRTVGIRTEDSVFPVLAYPRDGKAHRVMTKVIESMMRKNVFTNREYTIFTWLQISYVKIQWRDESFYTLLRIIEYVFPVYSQREIKFSSL